MKNVYEARQEGKTAYVSYRQVVIRNSNNTRNRNPPGAQPNVQETVQKFEFGAASPIASPGIRSPRTPPPPQHINETLKLRNKPQIKYPK